MAASIEIKGQTILLFLALIFVLLVSLLILRPRTGSIAELSQAPDQCLSCHADVRDMSSSHPVKTFGCAVCHLGNPLSTDKTNAHAGMVRNPSDLLWADKTCGQSKCHPTLVKKVRSSIMSSNAGLVSATLYQWQESGQLNDTLRHIHDNLPDTSLATDHLRKLCAGCHINKNENDFAGEIGSRGGGCNDCHLLRDNNNPHKHPAFSVQIGIDVCEKCHNRSNRTALNYQGKFESEGYGTPYERGALRSDTLSGGRFFFHLPADVHFKAGMVCIDCHTADEVMGDGKRHAHLEDQVRVRCADCHQAKFARPDSADIVRKIISVNSYLDVPGDSLFAVISAGGFFSNIGREKGKIILTAKTDGRKHPIPQSGNRAECTLPGHERLSCQACHAGWSFQDYGLHLFFDQSRHYAQWSDYRWQDDTEITALLEKQLKMPAEQRITARMSNKLNGDTLAGAWYKGWTFRRWEGVVLGRDGDGQYVPIRPLYQFYVSYVDSVENVWLDSQIPKRLDGKSGWSWDVYTPHTMQRVGRSCESCHGNTLAAGRGIRSAQKDSVAHLITLPSAPVLPGARLLNSEEQK